MIIVSIHVKCIKDIVSITHEMQILNTASYGLPGDFVPITGFSTLPLLLPDDVVRYIYHVIMVGTMSMIHKMHDDYYWASIYEIHKTHATHY